MSKKFALKINKISKSFLENEILKEVSFSLFFGEKIALIGANGSGKSTLAKIIIEKEECDEGNIEIFKNFAISYLPQEINENLLVFEYLWKNTKEEKQLRSKASQLLMDFYFDEEILLRKISSLSGGEKMKIFLAKIALEKSPIIILDEPTNNLDTEGIEFLERVIKSSNSAFLIISHDRAFLDKTVSKVIYLDENKKSIKIYDENYSSFAEKRKEEIKKAEMDWAESQKRKRKLEEEVFRKKSLVDRKINKKILMKDNNKMSASAHFNSIQSSAGKNKKRAEIKLKRFQEKEKPALKRPLKIDFSQMKRSGQKVLEIKELKLEYGTGAKISLEIFAGDKVLISGKNGAGKTTLIKTILKRWGKTSLFKEIEWGVNIELGYLPQDLEFKNFNGTFLDYFLKKTEKNQTDARKILARFGFADEEINTKINKLSPGVRGRGRIALMLANNPNVLILDEPTNNLDLEVLEKLEEALKKYQGTIIFVSHDKYFIEKISPNKIIEL